MNKFTKKTKKKRLLKSARKKLVEKRRQVLISKIEEKKDVGLKDEEGEGGKVVEGEVGGLDVEEAVRLAMTVDEGLKADGIGGGGNEEEEMPVEEKKGALAKRKRKKIDSNWANMKTELGAGVKKRRKPVKGEGSRKEREETEKRAVVAPEREIKFGSPTGVLAIDCEMVGVGPGGVRSALARVAVVNSKCEAVYHAYVKPIEKVVDYRTQYSGIRPNDLQSEGVVTFQEAQKNVSDLLKVSVPTKLFLSVLSLHGTVNLTQRSPYEPIQDRLLVGHAVKNDLDVLLLGHPKHSIRDTSFCSLLKQAIGLPKKGRALSLKRLTAEILGEEIQSGEHNPYEDAAATMKLYLKVAREWEAVLAAKNLKSKKRGKAAPKETEKRQLKAQLTRKTVTNVIQSNGKTTRTQSDYTKSFFKISKSR